MKTAADTIYFLSPAYPGVGPGHLQIREGADSPFFGMSIPSWSFPFFLDFDNDGDVDLLVRGEQRKEDS